MNREIQFLKSLRRRATIPVPDYTYVDDGYRVAGYRLIPGDSLDLSIWDRLTRDQRREIAVGVAQVFDAVHEFPVGEAEDLGIPRTHTLNEEIRRLLHSYVRIIRKDYLIEEEMKYCDGVVESIMATGITEASPCVIHGDMEPPHILHDGGQFTGVIDFGDVAIGDRAADIGYLWELGEEFIDDLLAHYRRGSKDLKRRSHWLWFGRAIPVMEWAAENRRQGAWERGYRLFPEGAANPKRARGCW